MKILCIADLDTLGWEGGSGQADLVISLGDHFDQVILGAAEAYEAERIFAVKGNHCSADPFPPPIRDAHLTVHQFGCLTFGGFNGCWKYKERGAFLYSQEEVTEALADFPPVDVFISHNSPRGIHDRPDGIHVGFDGLTAYIKRTQPKIVLHGHQHLDVETMIGTTLVRGIYGHRLLELR